MPTICWYVAYILICFKQRIQAQVNFNLVSSKSYAFKLYPKKKTNDSVDPILRFTNHSNDLLGDKLVRNTWSVALAYSKYYQVLGNNYFFLFPAVMYWRIPPKTSHSLSKISTKKIVVIENSLNHVLVVTVLPHLDDASPAVMERLSLFPFVLFDLFSICSVVIARDKEGKFLRSGKNKNARDQTFGFGVS